MIKEQHNRVYIAFFDLYSTWLLKRHFKSIRLIGEPPERHLPVLMIGNHFSWWDGFLQYRINKNYFQRRFHVMMLEEQLRRYPFLQKVGAFSIQKKSRDIIKSLRHCIDILQDSNNMLLLFPQGEIQTMHTRRYKFESGLDFILNRLDDAQIIFNINLVDYFSNKKPTLTLYFKEYHQQESWTRQDMQSDFNDFAEQCIARQVEE